MNRTDFMAAMVASGKYERIAPVDKWSPAIGVKRPTDKQGKQILDDEGNPLPSDHEWRLANLGASLFQIPVVQMVEIDGIKRTKTGTQYVTIFDLGLGQERVEWEEHPDREFIRSAPDTAFVDAVKKWYKDNKPATVVKFVVTEANKEAEFAILRVFDLDVTDPQNPIVTEGRKFISRDGSTITVADLA